MQPELQKRKAQIERIVANSSWEFAVHQLAAEWQNEITLLEQQLVEARKDTEMLRKSVNPLITEVKAMANGLIKPKRAIAPTSDTLHWEGVSPSELEDDTNTKIGKAWLKLVEAITLAMEKGSQ